MKDKLQQFKKRLENSTAPMDVYVRGKVEEMLARDETTLDILGIKHGTDKASLIDEKKGLHLGHEYLRHYEFFFSAFREREMSIVEFGCFRGQSLRLWKEYFPHAEIYGVDISKEAQRYEENRIHVIIGDVTKQRTYEKLERALGNKSPDIIIDDASHAWGDQRITLELFWKMLAPGGLYVVEDLECGSLGAYVDSPPEVQDSQPFFDYVRDLCGLLRWSPMRRTYVMRDHHFSQLPERIKRIQITLDECCFVPGAVILRKNPVRPPWEQR